MLIDNSAVQSNHLRFRLFQKTESLITAVGSDDEKIQPEDLPNNHVQPPSVTDGSPTPPVSVNNNVEENAPEETLTDDLEGENKNNCELLKEQVERGQSIFELFEQELS